MEDNVQVVQPAESTTATETTPIPDSGSVETQPTQDGQQASNRSFTQAQLEEILRKRLEQANKSWERKLAESTKKQQEYEALVQRMNSGIEAMGRGFGFIKDEEPSYVTRQDLESLQKQLDERVNGRLEEVGQAQIVAQMKAGWSKVEAALPKFAKAPGFRETWLNSWDPYVDPVESAKKISAEWQKLFAAEQNAEVEAKKEAAKTASVKPTGVTPPSKDQPTGPLRKRLQAALNSRE